jgi:8-oxo-dGTP diphosphatase
MKEAWTKNIEIIARGVCVKRGFLLLCHGLGAANTYLPGGHVEFGEPAGRALQREIKEEAGLDARIGRFLGVVENAFTQKGEPRSEVNLVFEMRVPGIQPPHPPASCEPDIEFLWVPLRQLRRSAIEPSILRSILPKWLRDRSASRWASSM